MTAHRRSGRARTIRVPEGEPCAGLYEIHLTGEPGPMRIYRRIGGGRVVRVPPDRRDVYAAVALRLRVERAAVHDRAEREAAAQRPVPWWRWLAQRVAQIFARRTVTTSRTWRNVDGSTETTITETETRG